MHYVQYCPMCDKPEPKVVTVYEFFKVAMYIVAHEGYDRIWVNNVLDCIDFPGNDCTVDYCVIEDEDEDEEVLRQFNAGLMKHFNLDRGDELMIEISW